jgi:hypothetical protein
VHWGFQERPGEICKIGLIGGKGLMTSLLLSLV